MSAWIRVSKELQCPCCSRIDWCLVSEDGSAVICPRTHKGCTKYIEGSGYLHVLHPSKRSQRHHRAFTISVDNDKPRPDFSGLARQYLQQMTSERHQWLAARLGVSVDSLIRLQVGLIDEFRFSFPMSDADGRLIGIRIRTADGRKYCVEGSRNGLFVPDGLSGKGPLLLTEGPSDCGAALDLGFDAIGRPNCSSLVGMTGKVCKGHDVVIIADNDPPKPDGRRPGLDGAIKLAEKLVFACSSVRVVQAPAEHKDLRNWLIAGLEYQQLKDIIDGTGPVRLEHKRD